MDMGQIVGQLKILVLVVGLTALLGAGALSEALRAPMSRPLVDAQGEDVEMERVSNNSGERFTVVKNSRRLPLSLEPVRVDALRRIVSHRYNDQVGTDFAI